MNERHSIQVYIDGEASIQEQLQTKGSAEVNKACIFYLIKNHAVIKCLFFSKKIISTPTFHTLVKPPKVRLQPLNSTNSSQRQQLRNFINSSSNLQARHQQHQPTTVRINPLIFKRQSAQQQPSQKAQQQQCNVLSNGQSQEHQQIYAQCSNAIGGCSSMQSFSKSQELEFSDASLSETANRLDLIVNEFQ